MGGTFRMRATLLVKVTCLALAIPPDASYASPIVKVQIDRHSPEEWIFCATPPGAVPGTTWVEHRRISRNYRMRVGPARTERHIMLARWDGSIYSQKITIKRSGYEKAYAERIWDYQQDNFFNVCIKENYDLSSEGGNLYCILREPAYAQVHASIR